MRAPDPPPLAIKTRATSAPAFAHATHGASSKFNSLSTKKKEGANSPPSLLEDRRKQLFMAGVRDPGHDVAPAVKHGGTCEFRTFRRTPLTHRRADGCRPLVHGFGIGVGDDDAARRRR